MSAFIPLEQRFWAKVDRRGPDECWPWKACRETLSGYGRIRLSRQRATECAHRVAYEFTHGRVPEGRIICHSCGNPACVNPAHLYAGTPHDNNMDRIRHGRQAGGANPGERHHMAKLTDAQAAEIRARLKAGESIRALLGQYPVGRSQLYRIWWGEQGQHAARRAPRG